MKRFDVQRRRLAWVLGGVFTLLFGASALLVAQSYDRLRFEALHGQRQLAEELTARIDQLLAAAVAVEESRPPTDYDFLVVSGERYVQRSPLSTLSPDSPLPGVIGYFQVDAAGHFSTPLLPVNVDDPDALSLTPAEFRQRRSFQDRLRRLLERNPADERAAEPEADMAHGEAAQAPARAAAPAERSSYASREAGHRDAEAGRRGAEAGHRAPVGQDIYEKLNSAAGMSRTAGLAASGSTRGNLELEESRLDDATVKERAMEGAGSPSASSASRETAVADSSKARSQRTEEVRQVLVAPPDADEPLVPRIAAFRSAVDPFSLARLDDGHLVAYRRVWLDEQRFQGMVVRQDILLDTLVGSAFTSSSLARHGDLRVAFEGDILRVYARAGRPPPAASAGNLLLRARLAAPADPLELIFSVSDPPLGAGATTLAWASAAMALVLLGGFYLLHRLGRYHIALAEQQQDFVSAVSHELKTPLTAIRMYGEILKAGWADDGRRQTYYDFILSESERLSRLIGNVLQLARITRGDPRVASSTVVTAAALLDQVESKVAGPVGAGGLALERARDAEAEAASVRVDEDGFMQVMINLVDNAIKFSAPAERRAVELGCRREGRWLTFHVRDYGPGVARDQMRRIFELFYRAESELTRETVGTGIGLALVRELVRRMGGRVDVVNRSPGAEFQVRLPLVLP